MPVASPSGTITVALIGNPNTGKSTLFNALSGIRQRVGNYPGVTVEKKVGHTEFNGVSFAIVDLPGTYSLAPRSPDEMIAVEVLLGRRDDVASPDVILCIVDASNLERNLYLVSQVLELGRPTVLALNMVDVARQKGITLNIARLQKQLGLPIVEIQANKKIGVPELKVAVAAAVAGSYSPPESPFPAEFQQEVANLQQQTSSTGNGSLPRYLLERLLLDTVGFLEQVELPGVDDRVRRELPPARERLAAAGCPVPAVEAMARYQWVAQVLEGVVHRPTERRVTTTDKIDHVLTHKLWGTLVFIAMMAVMFMTVFWVAEPASNAIDFLKELAGKWIERQVSDGPLRSLLIGGVVEGVGSVIVFVPQIFVLFLFIAVLEDCGYMARAAYLMDKLMSRVGLSGKSFIPLLSSFACAIPGIMSARVIENQRDRLVTILIAPLMSCSARLPVYTLLVGAFIPGSLWLRGLTLLALYAVGVIAAILVAFVLKKTLLKGATPPFVMELPSYKRPGVGIVLHRMFERGWAFVRRAGTLIFAVMLVVWAVGYYPHNPAVIPAALQSQRGEQAAVVVQLEFDLEQSRATEADVATAKEKLQATENEIEGLYLEDSYLGRAGKFIEPVVKPLGWDWRIGCAVIASFPAREVVVGTLGVIYHLGGDVDEESESLSDTLRGSFNLPVALSIMVFFALCAQCVSTLAVLKRETNSWRWPVFTFVYMTTFAYVAAWVTYRVGMLFM